MDNRKIFLDIAENFMHLIYNETGCPVIVYDDQGIIRKAIQKNRIGDPHAGALKILRGEVQEYAVTAEEAASNPNIKEGYSCPVVMDVQMPIMDGLEATGCIRSVGKSRESWRFGIRAK